MGEIKSTDNNFIGMTEDILLETRTDISEKDTISIPIVELATLGAGISSLVPRFRTITQTASINTQGLYTLSNSAVGDVLKASKDGSFWGALKTSEGTSKMAKFRSVDPITSQSTVTMLFNPAMIMIAVALYSIDKKLGSIEKSTKKILAFLEVEKESEIEADVETLMSIITKYKMNWENEQFRTTNHKLVLDIQRTARKNMISYQKEVNEMIRSTQIITIQSKVRAQLKDIQKKYKYYRLSLYSFSFASLLEIMLSGNYKEEYVSGIKNEINELSGQYRYPTHLFPLP